MNDTPLGLATALAFALALGAVPGWSAEVEPAAAATAPGQPETPANEAATPEPSAAATAPGQSETPASKAATPEPSAAATATATETPADDQIDSGMPAAPTSYLDAVRAQRESLIARERETASERSDAMRKQMEEHRAWVQSQARARRRWYDPQGEYLSELSQQRTEAMKAQSQALRDQAKQQADAMRKQMDEIRDARQRWMLQNTPYGWNNPWYYNGF